MSEPHLTPMHRRDLTRGWVVCAVDADDDVPERVASTEIAATVPGCVHLDLLRSGLIDDPYHDCNEAAVQWIGRTGWEYTLEFHWHDDGSTRHALVFDGIDTHADIWLGDTHLGATANMHRSHRFDVSHALRDGANTLRVRLTAPVVAAEEAAETHGHYPHANHHPYNHVRTMACSFGWDWGPDLATAGIWRDVRLESWTGARIAAVRPNVALEDGIGVVTVDVEIEPGSDADGPFDIHARVDSAGVAGAATTRDNARVRLEIENPDVWWPWSLGDQPLYELAVDVFAGGQRLDTWTAAIGFRSFHIETGADDFGSEWTMIVNGTRVWARGANWIPDDLFVGAITETQYRERIEQAIAANIDVLRVWGGGLYEADVFYDICDELGVLVWQDFAFACAAYPEHDTMVAEIEAEAIDNVTRLMPHPSLVLWNGSNENHWIGGRRNWQASTPDGVWGERFYSEILPAVVSDIDPGRPYWPGSPYSGDGIPPNHPSHGTMHIWDVFNTDDYPVYRTHRPRFVAEFGFQGPPTHATLEQALTEYPPALDSPVLACHQKAPSGADKIGRSLEAHFGRPVSFDQWHFLAQVNQARAIQLGIEWFRSLDENSGAVVWQLNDCWPVVSWSAIDGDGRRKPAWYAMRRSFSDRLVSIQPCEGGLELVAHNLADRPWTETATVRRITLDGQAIATGAIPIDVAARTRTRHLLSPGLATPERLHHELLIADTGSMRSVWSWVPDDQLRYPQATATVTVDRNGTGLGVTVSAHSLLRDVCLFADRISPDAWVDDMLVTLLPGETHRFEVVGVDETSTVPPDLEAFGVLRYVNGSDGPSTHLQRSSTTRHSEGSTSGPQQR